MILFPCNRNICHAFLWLLVRKENACLKKIRGRPAARASWLIAGESGRLDEFLQLGRQRLLVLLPYAGGEADVIQQAPFIV